MSSSSSSLYKFVDIIIEVSSLTFLMFFSSCYCVLSLSYKTHVLSFCFIDRFD